MSLEGNRERQRHRGLSYVHSGIPLSAFIFGIGMTIRLVSRPALEIVVFAMLLHALIGSRSQDPQLHDRSLDNTLDRLADE